MVKFFTSIFFVISLIVIGNAFKIEPRIVRGTFARSGQFPYFALLEFQKATKDSRCGATLISDQWLITAKHCLEGEESATVNLGIWQTVEIEPNQKTIIVGKENFHFPTIYDEVSSFVDMALIHLPEPIEFTDTIKPVRMPTTCEAPENAVSFAMGFGLTCNNGLLSPALKFAILRTIPFKECQELFPYKNWDKFLTCAYDNVNLESISWGDSGGPLVTMDGVFIGITSFIRLDGADNGAPQAFANIFPIMNWIQKLTGLDLPNCP